MRGGQIRIEESREYYYYNSATKEKLKFANSELREKSKNEKFAKIETCENHHIYSIHILTAICMCSYQIKGLFSADGLWVT